MNGQLGSTSRRPQQVTVAGLQAIVGGALSVLLLVNAALSLHSAALRQSLRQSLRTVFAQGQAAAVGLTMESALQIIKYLILVLGVLSTTSLVLGFFVLRRHSTARLVLTVLGALMAALSLFAGAAGFVVAAYIGVSVWLLWTRAARKWFSDVRPPTPTGAPPPLS